jgi:hypothetical protein
MVPPRELRKLILKVFHEVSISLLMKLLWIFVFINMIVYVKILNDTLMKLDQQQNNCFLGLMILVFQKYKNTLSSKLQKMRCRCLENWLLNYFLASIT